MARLLLALVSTLLVVALAESGLRYGESRTWRPRYTPDQSTIFEPAPGRMPGIVGPQNFTLNARGIRGDDFSDEQGYHVLAVGGSTTECLFVDDLDAWPYRTQTLMNDAGYPIWIGNVGSSGQDVKGHIEVMRDLLPEFDFIDAVVLMIGVNDMSLALRGTLDPLSSSESSAPSSFTAFYRNFELYKLWMRVEARWSGRESVLTQDEAGKAYDDWRANRRSAAIVDSMPDLDAALDRYEADLNALLDLGKDQGVRVILINQATFWRSNLTTEEQELMWFGWGGSSQVDSKTYYSVDVLDRGMALFNEVMARVCLEREVECIDVAAMLEKDTTTFYDDCHFNTGGSLKVADVLSDYLIHHTPGTAR